jgi:hypothetical protein
MLGMSSLITALVVNLGHQESTADTIATLRTELADEKRAREKA